MKYTIIDIPQRSKEWFDLKRGRIGMSMCGSILGVNPWRTRLQLWEDIILNRETQITPAMQKGIDLEPLALETFNKMVPYPPSFQPMVVQSIEYPEIIASLDGWNGETHVEIKITSKKEIPDHYYAQVQGQMMVLGTKSCWYFASPDGIVGQPIHVVRNENYIRNLLAQILLFIGSLVDFRPPEPCNRDEVEISDSNLVSLSLEYRNLERQIDDLVQRKESIRKDIISQCQSPCK